MNWTKRLLTIVVTSLVVVVATPLQTMAATNGIGVNPRKNYTLAPGETKQDVINVHNINLKSPLQANVRILDFQAMGQTGSPQLLLTRTAPTPWSLKPFLKIDSSISVAPGGAKDVPITITIPKGTGGGSYYSAIQFGGNADQQDAKNIGLTGSATTLIFVRVSGKANETMILKQFGTFVPSKDFSGGSYQTFFGSTKPKYLSYSLQNRGNVVEEPIGGAVITNMFGKEIKNIKNINPNHNLVILDQTRRIDFCIIAPDGANLSSTADSSEDLTKCKDPSLFPGRYTAKIDVIYGVDSLSNEITGKSTFWYIPAWSIIALIVLLAIVAGIVWLIWNYIQNARGRKYRARK